MRCRRILFLSGFVAVLLAAMASGDTISTWNGGSGNWSTAANWTPPVVPNNSGTTAYDVTIGTNGTVGLDISPTVNSLTLNGAINPLVGPSGVLYGVGPNVNTLHVVNDVNVTGALLFGGEIFPPPVSPASLSVGGNLNHSGFELFIVRGALVVRGDLTNAGGYMAIVSRTGSDPFQVGGTLTNQASTNLFLGNERCFSLNCAYNAPQTALLPGPTTTLGTLINNGNLYSWSNVTASNLTNNGSAAFIAGPASVKTVVNAGRIFLSNAASSIALEQTAALG